MTSIPVSRLNHAVLYVRDVDGAVEFYSRVFGFEEVSRIRNFGGIHARRRWRKTTMTLASSPSVRRSPAAARLYWPVPPCLGSADDRGPGHGRAGVARRRCARWRLRSRREQVALRRTIRTATSSRSCGASRASSGASARRKPSSRRSTSDEEVRRARHGRRRRVTAWPQGLAALRGGSRQETHRHRHGPGLAEAASRRSSAGCATSSSTCRRRLPMRCPGA